MKVWKLGSASKSEKVKRHIKHQSDWGSNEERDWYSGRMAKQSWWEKYTWKFKSRVRGGPRSGLYLKRSICKTNC